MPFAHPLAVPSRARWPQLRPDEMGAFVVDALLERNEQVDPSLIEEVYCGVGLPQGLQGFNMGRIIALLSERLPLETNGATVSRYCASSLESIRQASNAIVAGQGDAYIAAGVEWVSRYNEAVEGARPQDQNEKLQGGNGRPRRLHLDGPDRRERGRALRGEPRGHGQVRAALAGAGRAVAGVGLLRPRDRAGDAGGRHASSRRTTARAPARRSRSSRSSTRPSRRTARSPRATPAR